MSSNCGRDRIRTCKAVTPDGFQDRSTTNCPLFQLSPMRLFRGRYSQFFLLKTHRVLPLKKSQLLGGLLNVLYSHDPFCKTVRGVSYIIISNDAKSLSISHSFAGLTGVEPAPCAVTGRHLNRLTSIPK